MRRSTFLANLLIFGVVGRLANPAFPQAQDLRKDVTAAGNMKVTGSEGRLSEVLSYLDTFEFWYPIVTP